MDGELLAAVLEAAEAGAVVQIWRVDPRVLGVQCILDGEATDWRCRVDATTPSSQAAENLSICIRNALGTALAMRGSSPPSPARGLSPVALAFSQSRRPPQKKTEHELMKDFFFDKKV